MKVGVILNSIIGMHVPMIKDGDRKACRLGMSLCLIS
jgi:hypothetical protein